MFSALVGAAPQLGPAGVLVLVLGLLLRRESQTNERHASELERLNSTHQTELKGLRTEIAGLREQVNDLGRKLDDERRARWRAEDFAAGRQREPGSRT